MKECEKHYDPECPGCCYQQLPGLFWPTAFVVLLVIWLFEKW
jgi:hypothetical protein